MPPRNLTNAEILKISHENHPNRDEMDDEEAVFSLLVEVADTYVEITKGSPDTGSRLSSVDVMVAGLVESLDVHAIGGVRRLPLKGELSGELFGGEPVEDSEPVSSDDDDDAWKFGIVST